MDIDSWTGRGRSATFRAMAVASTSTPAGPPSAIRVGVIDGQPLFRDALARLVRQSVALALVGEAGTAADGLVLLRRERPHVALADLDLPALDGERLLSLARVERLSTSIVLVGASFDPEGAYELIALGAAGCVMRSASADELRHAIMTVASGSSYLATDVQHVVNREIRLRARNGRPVLTPRELEILHRIAEGERAPAIAGAMHLSLSTVKTHLAHLYEKFGVGDRAAAVAMAMRRGLLD
jgi:two-component system nitrate/nitrite response regulator NarL